MSLPVPNLDDRSWKQIVDEAVRLIPRYCPEWTNHNASDPGVTMLELYAWMTEMVIYRLNKVPEKNFLTFLDLIGVRLKPPEPAQPDRHRVAVLRRQALARDDAQPQRERSAPPRLRQPRRHREADRQQRGDLLDPRQAGRAPQGSAPGDARQHLAAHRDPRRGHGARVRLRQHRQLHLPPGRPGQELPPLRRRAEEIGRAHV